MRRIAVFAGAVTTDAAAQVAGFAPIEPAAVMDGLARLAEQSLLTARPAAGVTRYRMLEPIRQYGSEQLTATGEFGEVRSRHLRWCSTISGQLSADTSVEIGQWRARFDAVADDIRAALGWAADEPGHRADAYDLALALAQLTFTRNLIGEAQQRYEQAASLAVDPRSRPSALRLAAAAAGCRGRGEDMLRLYRAAAEAAKTLGDNAVAARDLATAAVSIYRFAGTFAEAPAPGEAAELLTAARELAGDDPAAQAAVALAECGFSRMPAILLPWRPNEPNTRSTSPIAAATPWPRARLSMRLPLPDVGPATISPPPRRLAAESSCSRRCRLPRQVRLNVPTRSPKRPRLASGSVTSPARADLASSFAICHFWPSAVTSPRRGCWWRMPWRATSMTCSSAADDSSMDGSVRGDRMRPISP